MLEPFMCAPGTESVDKSRTFHAFEVADYRHEGQTRKSGEPYTIHPVAATTILAELGMDEDTTIGAFLYDTVEDADYQLSNLRRELSSVVEVLIDGATKLNKVEYDEAVQAETMRKMVTAVSKNIRVLLIKLADRLHNARIRKYVPAKDARRKAREALEIYAPLAHRLGMNSIRWELGDRSFKVLYPTIYDKIKRFVTDRTPERETYILQVRDTLESELKNAKIKCTITGRSKHYCSIYQKMILRGKNSKDIYDLAGVRVLVETIADCYATLGVVNTAFTPIQGRIKDYIVTPKSNFYQSIYTTAIGLGGRTMEIQIRIYDMHKRVEYGVVAHWQYKEDAGQSKGGVGPMSEEQTQLSQLRQLADWQRDMADPTEFLDSFQYKISGSQVYVFTLKGEVLELPAGSMPVNFAYAVHTEVGHHTVGARVNDRLVTLDHRLEPGDNTEIITAKNPDVGPSRGWFDFVASQRARARIKAWFRRLRREGSVDSGENKLAKAIRQKNQPARRPMSHDALRGTAQNLNKDDMTDLYAAIGEGVILAETVVRHLAQAQGGEPGVEEALSEAVTPTHIVHRSSASGDSAVTVEPIDSGDVFVKLAKCYTPVPPDAIVDFVTRGNGLSVHRVDCPNVLPLKRELKCLIDVAWSEGSETIYLAQVQIEGFGRQGLFSDLSRVLSEHGINVLQGMTTTTKERMSKSSFIFKMAEPSYLECILREFRKVDGVYDVHRMTGSKEGNERRA